MLVLKFDDRISLAPNIALYGDTKNDFFLVSNVVMGEQFYLNSTSFWVMELFVEGIEWFKLKESFFQEFEVDRERSEKDLNNLISQLLELNLIKINGGEKNGEDIQETEN